MSWGGAALSPPPAAPFSGEIDSDTAGTTTIVDLGLGCLYIGGGGATSVPPSRVVDGSTSVFGVAGTGAIVPLVASAGNGPVGNTNTGMACTADANCGRGAGTCALDANCFFGPPLPIVNAGLSTCVVNGIQTDGSGTLTPASGDAVLGINGGRLPLPH
jgi:hypothetical protein